jgi:hypothetical protein
MATLECKLAVCISRLVEFELLLELKIEQKKGTSLVKLGLSRENLRHRQCADRTSIRPRRGLADSVAISKIYNWDGQTHCPRTDCFEA